MLKEKFLEFGYTEEEYYAIRNSYALSNYLDDTLLKKYCDAILFFLKLGYIKEEVIKMTKNSPFIYGLSIENIKQKIDGMVSLGYTKEEVIKMTKTLPAICCYNIENIKQKIDDMGFLGYTKDEVIKMTKFSTTIYSLNIETIKQKIDNLISLGYTKEEVIKMTKVFPIIQSLSIETIKQKMDNLVSLGYFKDEVIKMTKVFPTIYSLSIETMKQKIEFYDSIDMHELAVVDSKQLMQSVALSYARYMFYLSIGVEIDMINYKMLFINNKQFEKTYGVTKQEILEKYNYDSYMEDNVNKRVLRSSDQK